MASVLNPLLRLRMLRHAGGFGVHSPFAYRFITEVLNQPYAYYAYGRLRSVRERLLFRVALALDSTGPEGRRHAVRRIAIYGNRELRQPLRLALPRAAFTEHNPDLVVLDARYASEADRAALGCLLEAGTLQGAVVFGSFPRLREVLAAMPAGMTFDNHAGTVVVVPSPALPRQDFDVSF